MNKVLATFRTITKLNPGKGDVFKLVMEVFNTHDPDKTLIIRWEDAVDLNLVSNNVLHRLGVLSSQGDTYFRVDPCLVNGKWDKEITAIFPDGSSLCLVGGDSNV